MALFRVSKEQNFLSPLLCLGGLISIIALNSPYKALHPYLQALATWFGVLLRRMLKLMKTCCKGSLSVWCTCNSSRDDETSSRFCQTNHQASVESQVATNICEPTLHPTLSKSSQVTLLLPPPPHWHLVSCHIGYTTKTNFVQHGHDAWACHIVSSGLRKWASEYYIS
jgi:hypothetical protein